jgi:hypothetical protein
LTGSEDQVAHTETPKKTTSRANKRSTGSSSNRENNAHNTTRSPSPNGRRNSGSNAGRKKSQDMPPWLGTVMSVIGMGVAVGVGLYATRKQWMPNADAWTNDYSAAFADDETDYENFDQTRHAGTPSMRDVQDDDWSDIDDMSDASFPASDPPSFNPGTAG